jgi:hypothetical protein
MDRAPVAAPDMDPARVATPDEQHDERRVAALKDIESKNAQRNSTDFNWAEE